METGSSVLRDYYATKPELVFHVHGHSHDCFGMAQSCGISVINPGPLQNGRFAVLDLVGEKIQNLNFIHLI